MVLEHYLRVKGLSPNFEMLSRLELNDILKSFYLDVRKTDGALYKTGSMKALRHSLNRDITSVPYERGFDLIKDPEFRECNLNFDSMMAKLKREGFGETVHYRAICDADIRGLYSLLYICPLIRRWAYTTKCNLILDCIFFAVERRTCIK